MDIYLGQHGLWITVRRKNKPTKGFCKSLAGGQMDLPTQIDHTRHTKTTQNTNVIRHMTQTETEQDTEQKLILRTANRGAEGGGQGGLRFKPKHK